ncbi:MAG: diaminopimelate decarboxylase [Chloroflexi bacterium]|nr:diaminopimelate decarboxylase [Chloroflexota bacterium]
MALAEEFGTPLYVFDEVTLRRKCTEFRDEFGRRYQDTAIVYACKAFVNRALALLFKEEGLGLDVVSGGELSIARSVDFPMEKVYFHGNNKSAEELGMALEYKVGRIVIDNFQELDTLAEIAGQRGATPDVLLRLTPGVDPHTHKHISTGVVDSKFGIPLASAGEAVARAMSAPNLNLIGLHFHLGSQIFEVEPYREAIRVIMDLVAEMKSKHGFELQELDVGGGFAVQYTVDAPAPPVSDYAEVIVTTVNEKCREHSLGLPKLVIEPGRAIVGRAGVALYEVGVVKDIPGVRRYVSVDGGMADNIRPALYGARYEAVVASKMNDKAAKKVTIVGKFCESGDILIKDIDLPEIAVGDILAVPDCGAYCLAMGSNYNVSLKPAIVLVNGGKARLIRRRETYEDLLRCDLV